MDPITDFVIILELKRYNRDTVNEDDYDGVLKLGLFI